MERISNYLKNSRNIEKSAVVWNAIASMLNALQTMLLLMVITRFGTMQDASVFVMAYAVGNLTLFIGKYGIRQYQVTDIKGKYSFYEYLTSRKISSAAMVVIVLLYVIYSAVFNGYDTNKSAAVLLICFLRGIEAYEDVYHGLFQQKGRLDIASKVLGIRMAVFIIGCAVMFVLTKKLLLTLCVNIAVTLLLTIILNKAAMKSFSFEKKKSRGKVKQQLIECFPLCACFCLNVYISNAPKYIIDSVVDDKTQTCFNIIFMPVFVIALLATFVFQPVLKSIGEIWVDGQKKLFVKRLLRYSFMVVVGCLAVTFVGSLIGTQVLGIVYNVDLIDYKNLLILFMLAGGIIALQNLFTMAITVVRYQKYMIYGYIMTTLIILLPGKYILKNYGLDIMSLFFTFAMLILLIYCIVLVRIAIKKDT